MFKSFSTSKIITVFNFKFATLIMSSWVLSVQIPELMGQTDGPKLDRAEISVTLDAISHQLRDNYVFPETADKMAKHLSNSLNEGNYRAIEDHSEFARQLTKDLRAISKDKHLRVVYNPSIIAREKALTDEDRSNEEAEWIKTLVKNLKRDNYGFREVKILEGNVGYMDIREFVDPKYGGETLTSAMHFLCNTSAMIIDLRNNDGGFPGMVQLLASYFFSGESIHLANHYNRPKDELTQSWTLPYVPGARRPNTDLFILTSKKTFSAAEAFSYFMKHLGRATIVGEQTSGGAHLTGSVIATDKFYVRIPQGRPTSPITNANWEGVGVTPHIKTSSDQALKTAHDKILENLGIDK